MNPNASMTGTFRLNLPAELMHALERNPVEDPGKDMQVGAMRPSLFERILALVTGSKSGRR
jgi:hypothetical protein